MKKIIIFLFVILCVILADSVFAVDTDSKDIAVSSVRTYTSALAKKKLSDLMKADQHPVRAGEYLTRDQGFTALDTKDSYWGMEIVVENTKLKKSLTCVFLIQDYSKKDSKDFAAVAHTTVTVEDKAGPRTELYPFGLIATGGKVETYSEFYIDQLRLKVLPINSFIKKLTENISAKCKTCATAVGKCAYTSWSSYMACISKECGECFARVLAAYACGCAKICSDICGCAGR